MNSKETTDWKKEVKRVIKTHLAQESIGYDELSEKLLLVGVEETAGNIASKISRGTFSFIFVFQICKALGIKSLSLEKP